MQYFFSPNLDIYVFLLTDENKTKQNQWKKKFIFSYLFYLHCRFFLCTLSSDRFASIENTFGIVWKFRHFTACCSRTIASSFIFNKQLRRGQLDSIRTKQAYSFECINYYKYLFSVDLESHERRRIISWRNHDKDLRVYIIVIGFLTIFFSVSMFVMFFCQCNS